VFVKNNVVSLKNTDIQGRLGAGGSVNFGSSIGDQIDGPGTNTKSCATLATDACYQYSAVVGGTAIITGSVFGGPVISSAYTKKSNSTKSVNYQCGAFVGSPLNFPALFGTLATEQALLAKQPPTGLTGVGPNLVFLGTFSTTVEYFTTTVANLETAKQITLQNFNPAVKAIVINVTPGSPALTSLTLHSFDMSILSQYANRIIWNFDPSITTITLMNLGFEGTILATGATIEGSSGQINGQVIASSYLASLQVNLPLFTGCFSSQTGKGFNCVSLNQGVQCPGVPSDCPSPTCTCEPLETGGSACVAFAGSKCFTCATNADCVSQSLQACYNCTACGGTGTGCANFC